MAKYTISIREELQRNAGTSDIRDLNVLLPVAKATLFGNYINVLSDQYRDKFALGFALHFFNDEIGLETWTAWQMALAEKLVNNKEYIERMYGLLDKNIFSNYHVRKSNTDSITSGTADTTSKNTATTDNTHSDNNTVDVNGTAQRKESGTDETTGSTNNTTTNDLTQTTNGSSDTNTNGTTTNSGENVGKYSDTPQNGLSGLMTDTYLTNATIGTQSSEGTNTSNTGESHNDTVTNSGTVNDSGSSTQTFTRGGQTDDTNQSKTTGVNSGSSNTESEANGTTNTVTSGTGNTTVDEESYDLSMEMLMTAEPLLNKVWRIFDDIFFMMLDDSIF